LRESNSSRLEELPPLVGSILPVFGVASSMRLIHLLGCILEKKPTWVRTDSVCKLQRKEGNNSENRFGGRAPWSPFLKFLKFDILKFKKFPEKNPRCSQ
jgi:hypothetical protein